VGELLGDGAVLQFSETKNLANMTVCLEVTYSNSSIYIFPDFATLSEDGTILYPLGLDNDKIYEIDLSDAIFWCAVLDYQQLPAVNGKISLFPIIRVEDYESETESYTDSQTKSLMYTLGVCYSLLAPLFLLTVVCFSIQR
jgi:hypothetical protein